MLGQVRGLALAEGVPEEQRAAARHRGCPVQQGGETLAGVGRLERDPLRLLEGVTRRARLGGDYPIARPHEAALDLQITLGDDRRRAGCKALEARARQTEQPAWTRRQ